MSALRAFLLLAPALIIAGGGCSGAQSDHDEDEAGEGGSSGGGARGGSGGGSNGCSALVTCTSSAAVSCSGVACSSHTEIMGGLVTTSRFCGDFDGNGCSLTSCAINGVTSGSITCSGSCDGFGLEIGDGARVCAINSGRCVTDDDCTNTNARSSACVEGQCDFTCDSGFADCDGFGTNGCETDFGSPSSCGTTCGDAVQCSSANGDATCEDGVCGLECDVGFADCGGDNDGCETNLNASATCGAACDELVECATGVETCADGACETCAEGSANCDELDTNGCETDLTSTDTCGTSCDDAVECSTVNGEPSCEEGACTLECNVGYGDCAGANDGCETDLNVTTACGTTCDNRVECTAAAPDCQEGACVPVPSCVGLAATCGASSDGSCCTSLPVAGGRFLRGYDGNDFTSRDHPAVVSDFRLDAFEITVGRFRAFVSAWNEGWRPAAGAGKHAHLASGEGVVHSDGQIYESGWDSSFTENVEPTNANLGCETDPTWTNAPGANEQLPMTCINWFEAYAFCIWDGGFLPSLAEWHYAASGGSEQRVFPWSDPPSSTAIDCSYANHNPVPPCVGVTNDVGSESPKGDGRYGQTDLAGNVREWVLDSGSAYEEPCNDCADLSSDGEYRQIKGGSYWDGSPLQILNALHAANSSSVATMTGRNEDIGARCARAP